jgi:hypothetical protein
MNLPPLGAKKDTRVTTPNTTVIPIGLTTQTGMPQNYHSRSRELIYDSLMGQVRFVLNPYGPQKLYVARSNHHW